VLFLSGSGARGRLRRLTREIDFVPTYVLRLDHNRLLDASSEFKAFFDDV